MLEELDEELDKELEELLEEDELLEILNELLLDELLGLLRELSELLLLEEDELLDKEDRELKELLELIEGNELKELEADTLGILKNDEGLLTAEGINALTFAEVAEASLGKNTATAVEVMELPAKEELEEDNSEELLPEDKPEIVLVSKFTLG
jgi:hypothetical protein